MQKTKTPIAPSLSPDAPLPKAWPFEEARKITARMDARASDASEQAPALLETGYGPSGLPHIGTFGEVARTTWVRQAYEALTGRPTRLLAFSDDMDALRKVPTNVPEQEMLAKHLGLPLTRVPDPFGEYDSFAAHNNARLRQFLDSFGFDYEFASATQYYTNGTFDAALRRMLEVHDEVVATIIPTLGPERRATYSPVLPIHPETGQVMQVPIIKVDPDAGTVVWKDEAGKTFETSVLGGHAKMQWKADWAMRWYALGVDYEMSGKDLIDSVKLSSKICRILGKEPPAGLTYELFLDAQGQKISKSKGNGLSVEEWLRYGTPESLAQYMFQQPTRAKRLFFDVIPRATDDYLTLVQKAETQEGPELMANPVWFIHGGTIRPEDTSPVSYTALLNLANVANADKPETLWKFLRRYDPTLSPETHPYVDRLVHCALTYFKEQVYPNKTYRAPTETERKGLEDLADELAKLAPDTAPGDVQDVVFEVGKRYFAKPELRSWFGCLYEVLLGQTEGPRFGIFASLFGLPETVGLIRDALARPVEEPVQD
ncbi:lysine--tRNA ligase [Gluconobacter oxydans]|uniref:Lysine--tRNA ligase n=1 Tax=Gluconobacter oxydans (strain 621H) TaxID=290633 RepID=Q5FPQ3_GLUOX|nr:lysine--tRNA ligase [Gluconobacter oxydans]AAW61643.1 Lysyl-tRNA synthetase [Gluconobacter oxydans 621H]KXV11920.1 lysine--tRNA ligase [Gluconobacter oxydans]MCP1248100.1 lysine--tRNA ligase [Gluconobacter oxydans]WKE47733.1 lysine--tRNA ligase [Gluconobacter oxydans]